MCTYNGERFVREQLESLAAQTVLPHELIICDDRSTDRTTYIIEEFSLNAPFPVRLHINEKNLGITKNFERAISLCENCEIIALADQDDVWCSEKLARIAKPFLASAKVGLVFTDAEMVDERLHPLGEHLWSRVKFNHRRRIMFHANRAFEVFLQRNVVTGATMAFAACLKPLVLPIPNNIKLVHDGWIALVISLVAEVAFIDEPLVKYRQHRLQQTGVRGFGFGLRNLRGVRLSLPFYDNEDKKLISEDSAQEIIERLLKMEGAKLLDNNRLAAKLAEKISHLYLRAHLSEGARARRLLIILRELLALRYHRYSSGFRSAAKDFLLR
jgi:glycosyltransferase involved in cell wall biosynthesis